VIQKLWVLALISAVLAGCNAGESSQNRQDSLEKKVDSESNRVWDSAQKELKKQKDSIREKLGSSDSLRK
jgi:hypothetical protein